MRDLARRVAKLEMAPRARIKDATRPTIAEHQDACAVKHRYFTLTDWRMFTAELNPQIELPPLTMEERDFIRACDGGALALAQAVCDRYDRSYGRKPWSDMTEDEREAEKERGRREIEAMLGPIDSEPEPPEPPQNVLN